MLPPSRVNLKIKSENNYTHNYDSFESQPEMKIRRKSRIYKKKIDLNENFNELILNSQNNNSTSTRECSLDKNGEFLEQEKANEEMNKKMNNIKVSNGKSKHKKKVKFIDKVTVVYIESYKNSSTLDHGQLEENPDSKCLIY